MGSVLEPEAGRAGSTSALICTDRPIQGAGWIAVEAVHRLANPAPVAEGIVMITAGLLRLGRLMRFVPSAVMTGFITAVGINIVLGQLANLTGDLTTKLHHVLLCQVGIRIEKQRVFCAGRLRSRSSQDLRFGIHQAIDRINRILDFQIWHGDIADID